MSPSKHLILIVSCALVACGDDAVPGTNLTTTDGDATTGIATSTTLGPGVTLSAGASTGSSGSSETDGLDTTTASTDTTGPDDNTSTGAEVTSSTGDTTGLPMTCGDDMIDGTDICDGADLGAADCISEGFDGGVLACAEDCTFDTSACTECGNDALEGDEVCDNADLNGEDCVSQGFFGGALSCSAACIFDTSACSNCGDGMLDVGEDCEMDDLAGATCQSIGMGFTGGMLACGVGCGFDTSACTNLPPPIEGELIITEIMQNPSVLSDANGEWFEVHNPSAATTYQLGGCEVNDAAPGFVIEQDLEIPPGGYLIFARQFDGDQGFAADYQWSGFSLNNSTDSIQVVCAGTMVDTVGWDNGATFPDPNGASMTLDPGAFDANTNDLGLAWCEATSDYNGDLGTPGGPNDSCPQEAIDFCRLQFPAAINEPVGTDTEVFARLFIAGLTDQSGINDPSATVIGYVGYGPDATDPAVDAGWTWTSGTPNAGYGPASPGYEANNDEYRATLTAPGPTGDYDFAFRFSGNGGLTFTYCDTEAGSSNGYLAADAGQMTTGPIEKF